MKTIIAAALSLLLTTTAVAQDHNLYGSCRSPRAALSASDYHRIKGLLRKFPHKVHQIDSIVYIEFNETDWAGIIGLKKRLENYGGLKCRHVGDHATTFTQALPDGSVVDCIAIDLPQFHEFSCDWQHRRKP